VSEELDDYWDVLRLPLKAEATPATQPWTIYVWWENQRMPATLYGKANYPTGFNVVVSRDPTLSTDFEKRVVRYHFK